MAFYRWVDEKKIIKPPFFIRAFMASALSIVITPVVAAVAILMMVVLYLIFVEIPSIEALVNYVLLQLGYGIIGLPVIMIVAWLIGFEESTDFLIWLKLPLYHPDAEEQQDPHAAFKPNRN